MLPMLQTLSALIGGMLCFMLLIECGRWLVRRLALPQDLPEALRFESPPPEAHAPGDPAAARARAATRARRRAVGELAARACVAQQQVVQLAGELHDHPQLNAEQRGEIASAEHEAGQAAETAQEAWQDEDVDAAEQHCREAAERAETACARAAAIGGALAERDDRRRLLRWMLLFGIALLLWLLVASPWNVLQ